MKREKIFKSISRILIVMLALTGILSTKNLSNAEALVEKEKQVTTVANIGDVTYITFSGRMVVDKNCNTYYLDGENLNIIKNTSKKSETIVNYSNNLPLFEGKVIKEKGFDSDTYYGPKLVYDRYRDKVYLVGVYSKSKQLGIYEIQGNSITLNKIFTEDETLNSMTNDRDRIIKNGFVCEDGGMVLGTDSSISGYINFNFKVNNGSIDRINLGSINNTIFEFNNEFYNIDDEKLGKYNFSTQKFEKIDSDHVNYSPLDIFAQYKDKIYYKAKNSIYEMSLDGNSNKVLDLTRVKILDSLTLRIGNIFMVNDNEFLFYDDISKKIRKIEDSKNYEKAENKNEIPVEIILNQEHIIFPDAKPLLLSKEGRTIIPVRFIAEKLGAQVKWDNNSQTVTITSSEKEIKLKVGENYALVNGEILKLDSSAKIISGRTYVPLRFISESLDCSVEWDSEKYIVNITK